MENGAHSEKEMSREVLVRGSEKNKFRNIALFILKDQRKMNEIAMKKLKTNL